MLYKYSVIIIIIIIKCVIGLKDFVYVSSKVESLNPPAVLAGKKDLSVASKRETVNLHVNSCIVSPVIFAKGYPQKKDVIPIYCYQCHRIKYVKGVSCVDHLSSVSLVTNVPTALICSRSTCRGHIAPVLGEVGSPRGQPQSSNSTPSPSGSGQI